MLLRIIKMMVTLFTVFSTIQSKVVTTVHAKLTFYRLAEVSNAIIDQCVAQGVPFAREYGGLLDNRSFGGAQVSRTFYAPRSNRTAVVAGCLLRTEPSGKRGYGETVHAL